MRQDDSNPAAAARIALGDLTLNLPLAQLERADGELVKLRPQAYAVLNHLAIHAGQLVTKEALFAAVWPGVVVTDDSLTQAIGDIRRALGSSGHRLIRTVPRRGYMLLIETPTGAVTRLPPEQGPSVQPGPTEPAAPDAPDAAAEPAPGAASPSRRRLFAIGGAAACAVLATGAVWSWRLQDRSAALASPADAITPTIAVLPFNSGSVDGTRPWIGTSLSIGITSALARLSRLPVLWTRSVIGEPSNQAEHAAAAIQQRATHLLFGSVQSDDQRVRVTVQLTRTDTGQVLWSEKYEKPLSDVFALEDDITAKTVAALQLSLIEGEQARSRTHPRGNVKAWELATRAYVLFQTGGPEPLAEAHRLFEQALALDPGYAWARAFLAATLFLEGRFRFVPDPAAALQRAFDEANLAVRTDSSLPDVHSTLGGIFLGRRQYESAVASGLRALALGPNDAEIHAVLAQTLFATGAWSEAVGLSRRAIELTVRPPSWNYIPQCFSLVYLGMHSEAIAAGQRMLRLVESPYLRVAAVCAMAFALVESGRLEQARGLMARDLPQQPGVGATAFVAGLLFKENDHAERLTRALRDAGMPG